MKAESDLLIAGLDLETTGFVEPDHRIVEVYVGLWRGRKRLFEFNQRINPQRSMPADAQRVHKISLADLAGKPTWDTVAPMVVKVLSKADLYVAHNGDEFDLPFLRQELGRVGLALPERPSVDTMRAKWAHWSGKNPKLAELCFACGVDYDPALAHAADYDVEVMMQAFFRGLDFGSFALPQIPEVTHGLAA